MNQAPDKNPTSFITASDNGESEKSIPLGVGDMMGDASLDPLATVSEGRKFKAGSLVLVIVIIVACAGLWFMKSMTRVGAAQVGNSEVEASIEKFISSLSGKASMSNSAATPSNALGSTDANVLAVLSGSYIERQIPLDGVQRNPFIIYGEASTDVSAPEQAAGSFASRRIEKQTAFEKAAERLELKSVLMGSQPLANIGGKIIRKGEELVMQPENVAFRVADITKESVTVVGEDASLNLNLTFIIVLKR